MSKNRLALVKIVKPKRRKSIVKKEYGECMRYSVGDIVRFKIGPDEVQKGEVRFIEKSHNEDILYINSFNGWAYKVTEKRIV